MNKEDNKKVNFKDISFINEIKSMAVIGPSEKRNFFFLKNNAENFKGEIYAVHPTIKEIPDFKQENIYPSVKNIPNDVDFVFIAIPSSKVLEIMDECAEKGVKLATVFSSEFSDSGTPEGIELEKELLKRSKNKVRILGPNGMGLYYPKLGLAWRTNFPTDVGNIGFIAQSGGISNIVIYTGSQIGIHFSKVFSFGNGADLDFVDLLYFLSNDPETEIILCYIEGIKEGRADDLRKVLSQNKKPIIALKGGKSSSGKIAAKTHSASIAGENKIWQTLFKQYNVIEVQSIEQLLHTALLIDFYGIFDLRNIAVFSISGGYGVVLADLIEEIGQMRVPSFSPEIQAKLDEKFFIRGTSSKNPLDVAALFRHRDIIKEIFELVLSDSNIDGLIMDLPSWYLMSRFFNGIDSSTESNIMDLLSLGHKYSKPIIPIIQKANFPEVKERISKILAEKKIPVFETPLEFLSLLPKISKFSRNLKD